MTRLAINWSMFRKGVDPGDWKPMSNVGAGTRKFASGNRQELSAAFTWRRGRREYILHCFQKKTPKTSQQDLDWASLNFPDTALMFLAASVANR
jgi:phage-related protein